MYYNKGKGNTKLNKALQYMLTNPKKVLAQAKKITRNLEKAEDVVQDVLLFFHQCPEREVQYPAGYVWMTLYSFNRNSYSQWDKHMQYDMKSPSGGKDMSAFDTIPSDSNYEASESKMTVESMMNIAGDICTNKEIQAIIQVLEKDDAKNETIRCQRRSGILRLQEYFLNEVVGIARYKNSPEMKSYKRKVYRTKYENNPNS